MADIDGSWRSNRARAGLHDVRIHDMRHRFASRALALGKLLGHTQVQTTARYAHLGRNSVKVAAVRIADGLETDMDPPPDVPSTITSVPMHHLPLYRLPNDSY